MSIKQASTFRGFCQRHDKVLFSEIEDTPPELTLRTALLFSIRSEALENFRKRQANALLLEALKNPQAFSVPEPREVWVDIFRHGHAIELSFARISKLFGMYHAGVAPPELYYLLLKFKGSINYACSATIDPAHTHTGLDMRGSDFDGVAHNQIWGFAGNIGPCAYFSLATLETFSGHRTPLFLRDLEAGTSNLADRVLSFFALHSGDLMVRPSWYSSLSAEKRELLRSFREDWLWLEPVAANQYHLTIGHPSLPIEAIQRSSNLSRLE